MSTKVRIKNFQSIESVDFDIDGFTVIVGTNNIGKSAVIRAIESAIINRTGKAFIRKGKKQTEVEIHHNGMDIIWTKGDKTTYKVKVPGDATFQDFSALGAGVIPKPLSDGGFDKMELGDEKLSPLVAQQFRELFLVDKSGATVTQVISNLYNIDTLSEADNLCQKELKMFKGRYKTREIDLKAIQDKLEIYKDFEDLKRQVSYLMELEKTCKSMGAQIEDLLKLEKDLLALSDSVKRLSNIKDVLLPEIEVHEKLFKDIEWLKEKESGFLMLEASIKKLTPVQNIIVPDHTVSEKALIDVAWLVEKEKVLIPTVSNLKKLKNIKDISIPECSHFIAIFEDIKRFGLWESSLELFTKSIEKINKGIGNLDIEVLNKLLNSIELLTNDLKSIADLHTVFYNAAIATKKIRDEFKGTEERLINLQKEKSLLKVCPACERPF